MGVVEFNRYSFVDPSKYVDLTGALDRVPRITISASDPRCGEIPLYTRGFERCMKFEGHLGMCYSERHVGEEMHTHYWWATGNKLKRRTRG